LINGELILNELISEREWGTFQVSACVTEVLTKAVFDFPLDLLQEYDWSTGTPDIANKLTLSSQKESKSLF